MDAKLIDSFVDHEGHTLELRYSARKSDTWPGFHENLPLGRRGYWYGRYASHTYLGGISRERALAHFEGYRALLT